jgi:hypothetical protein
MASPPAYDRQFGPHEAWKTRHHRGHDPAVGRAEVKPGRPRLPGKARLSGSVRLAWKAALSGKAASCLEGRPAWRVRLAWKGASCLEARSAWKGASCLEARSAWKAASCLERPGLAWKAPWRAVESRLLPGFWTVIGFRDHPVVPTVATDAPTAAPDPLVSNARPEASRRSSVGPRDRRRQRGRPSRCDPNARSPNGGCA